MDIDGHDLGQVGPLDASPCRQPVVLVQFDEMVRPMAMGDALNVYAAAGHQLYASRDEGSSWKLLVEDLTTARAMIA